MGHSLRIEIPHEHVNHYFTFKPRQTERETWKTNLHGKENILKLEFKSTIILIISCITQKENVYSRYHIWCVPSLSIPFSSAMTLFRKWMGACVFCMCSDINTHTQLHLEKRVTVEGDGVLKEDIHLMWHWLQTVAYTNYWQEKYGGRLPRSSVDYQTAEPFRLTTSAEGRHWRKRKYSPTPNKQKSVKNKLKSDLTELTFSSGNWNLLLRSLPTRSYNLM